MHEIQQYSMLLCQHLQSHVTLHMLLERFMFPLVVIDTIDTLHTWHLHNISFIDNKIGIPTIQEPTITSLKVKWFRSWNVNYFVATCLYYACRHLILNIEDHITKNNLRNLVWSNTLFITLNLNIYNIHHNLFFYVLNRSSTLLLKLWWAYWMFFY